MEDHFEAQDGNPRRSTANELLSWDVECADIQTKITPPQTAPYDGKTDPETHLSKYRIYMTGRGAINATKYR
ncbi:hypothetical protein ACS0TY_011253 [Phlomoides rotata]